MTASLPPLPERFGNPMVRDFNEIVSAAEVDWMPQTIGWYVLALALGIVLLHRLLRALRQWLRNRYRREALRRLDTIAGQSALSLSAINALLKTTAMVAASREEVASLTGNAWLNWLAERVAPSSEMGKREASTREIDTLSTYLNNGLYANSATLDSNDPGQQPLLTAVRWWILNHRDSHGPA